MKRLRNIRWQGRKPVCGAGTVPPGRLCKACKGWRRLSRMTPRPSDAQQFSAYQILDGRYRELGL